MAQHEVKPARPRMSAQAAVPGVGDFRTDPLFPRIERAVASILAKGKVVTPVDMLVTMQLLAPDKLEDWRRGRVPYLEQVTDCNLTRLSRLLRILRFHAHDLKLVPTQTVCHRHGKGPKQALRFTKTGDVNLEAAYARHFAWPGKQGFKPLSPSTDAARPAGSLDDNPRSLSPLAPEA